MMKTQQFDSIEIKTAQLIIIDIQNMLKDFGDGKASKKISEELKNYYNKAFDNNLIYIWIIILSQYVPKEKYKVYYNPKIFNVVPYEHKSKILDRAKEIQNKIEKGENINAEEDKILPKLKYPNLDLLREQSNITHLHLSLNNKRTNYIILAKVNIYEEKSITFEKIITHQQMREDYLNLEYEHRKLVPASPIKGMGIITKVDEFNLRKQGIQCARGGVDEQAYFHIPLKLHVMSLTIYMSRNLRNYDNARDVFFNFKKNLIDYYYNFGRLFPKNTGI